MAEKLDIREEAISWGYLRETIGFEFAEVTPDFVNDDLPEGSEYVAWVLYDEDDIPKALAYAWNVENLDAIQGGMLLEIVCYEGKEWDDIEQLISWLEEHFVLAFVDDYSDWSLDRGYIYPRPGEVTDGYVFVKRDYAKAEDLVRYVVDSDTLEMRGMEKYADELRNFLLEAVSK